MAHKRHRIQFYTHTDLAEVCLGSADSAHRTQSP